LIEWGSDGEVSNTLGMDQAYQSAAKVYKLLGQPDRVGIMRVPGFHGVNDQEACLDWLDIQFGLSTRVWKNELLVPWDLERWRAMSKETVDVNRYHKAGANSISATSVSEWEARAAAIRKSAEWMLGDEPARMPPPPARGGRGGALSRRSRHQEVAAARPILAR
jgi:hypothetical protein